LLPREAQAARQALTVSVDSDAGSVEGMTEDHIGGFSADSGKLSQLLHRRWHFTVEFLD
jgi:hypothetical protein